jgi:hypothetical protein
MTLSDDIFDYCEWTISLKFLIHLAKWFGLISEGYHIDLWIESIHQGYIIILLGKNISSHMKNT